MKNEQFFTSKVTPQPSLIVIHFNITTLEDWQERIEKIENAKES